MYKIANTNRIQALMMFQTFATGELTRLGNGEETSNKGGGYERLVSVYLYDKALEWHKQFLKIHGENVLWSVYEKEITARFNSVFEDPMVEIKILKHDGEVKLYQEQFEVLLYRLELTESYAVSLFIGGLKSEISMPIRMFKPTTLKDASCLARMQEATLALKKTKPVSHYANQRSNSGTYANRYTSHATPITMTKPLLPLPSTSSENASKVVKSRKHLTQKELEEAKGLCFYCDQRYAPGHKCPRQLYSLEVCVDEIDEVEELCDDMEIREDN
ncbi:reverse transcriptase [Tanacetum coccineum]